MQHTVTLYVNIHNTKKTFESKVNHVNQLRLGIQVTLLNDEAKTELNNSILFISLLSAESIAQWSVTRFTIIEKKFGLLFITDTRNGG